MKGKERIGLILCTLLVLALPALATEITVKNDSYVDGGSVVVVGDFVPGEMAGARLTSPCNGNIVAVQIAWMEGTPGHEATIERFIHIYNGNTFPTPGTELATLEAPYMTPGAFNEFRYLDDQNSIPLIVPVTSGQQFYVTLEFDNATTVGTGGPSVCRDVSGCQAGKNHLFAIPGGWYNSCALLIQGDWLIRAVIDCPAATGACCLPDGSCQVKTQSQCTSLGGTYKGDNVSCTGANCPQPQGACCIVATHGCLNLTQSNCATVAGIWAGAGTNCTTYVCFPSGACCLPDGTCQNAMSPEECAGLSGTFQGNATTCSGVTCPLPQGACCLSNGNCIVLSEADCAVVAGSWAGATTDCADNNSNGKADVCETTLLGDMNCDTLVNGQDIDGFVLALFNPAGYAQQYPTCNMLNGDFTADGIVNGQDIDGFVNVLFGK